MTAEAARIAILLKGYPRLSETFVAQELLALERRGVRLAIWSLRRPTDPDRHPIHAQIRSPVTYLPEYLHEAPLRVLAGLFAALRRPRFPALLRLFAHDLRRDRSASRLRRFGQAVVLAREVPDAVTHLHAHFLHTPASVARYCAVLTGRSWSFSAHAKDIWTTPDWELSEKLADADWGVACTRDGLARLHALDGSHGATRGEPGRTALAYHGLDLARFPAPPPPRAPRDGADPGNPLRLLCVGRLVEKKGHDDLLEALTLLPRDLHWRLSVIGSGELGRALRARVEALGFSGRVAFLGAMAQARVIAAMREADLFVLPTKPADDGDRDGLPNVLMEAASQDLAIIATDFAGTPEFIVDGRHGVLVRPGDAQDLSAAIVRLARDPADRDRLAKAARERLVQSFSMEAGIDLIAARLCASAGLAPYGEPAPAIIPTEMPACAC